MKKIMLYEPSIGSDNLGDGIIVEGVKSAINMILDKSFTVELPTHTPLSYRYLKYLGNFDLKFVCGSNLLVGKLNSIIHLRQWALDTKVLFTIGPCILFGVGAQQYNQKVNLYTKLAYKRILSNKFIHSVRDGYTETALKNIGIENIINTGCPTMWSLTPKHCSDIPKKKAKNVVLTLTDYKPDKNRDEYIIDILHKNYDNVYFWPQGCGDYDYFNSLSNIEGINLVTPTLKGYNQLLEKNDIDFVGTRLHGGIRALQYKKRTIIIGIDNRANEKKKDFNIPVICQSNISELEKFINSEFETKIKLPKENISKFLKQFGIDYKGE